MNKSETPETVVLQSNPEIELRLADGVSYYTLVALRYPSGGQTMSGFHATEASINLAKTLRNGDTIDIHRDNDGEIIKIALVRRVQRG